MLEKYRYFLFDWDGCLARTLEVWLNAYRVAYTEFGVTPSDIEIAHHFGDWQAPKHYGVQDVEGCINRVVEVVSKDLKQVDLYDGARELLVDIKNSGAKLALLSSSKKEALSQGIEHNSLQGFFDVIISGDDVVEHKPNPEVIEKGLLALDASDRKRAVMIGDSRKDLGAAKNAGIDSVLMYPESHKIFYDLNELKGYEPSYIFSGFVEFKENLS